MHQSETATNLRNMRRELLDLEFEEEIEVFQIDESVFVGSDRISKAYSLPNENIELDQVNDQEKQSAKVIGALSNKGTYLYMVMPKYFDRFDILKYIKFIERKMRGKRWAIFWDNCRTHHAIIVKEYLIDKDIACVFNLPYKPEYNGIESLWSYQKAVFRKEITKAKCNKEVLDVMNRVIQIQKDC